MKRIYYLTVLVIILIGSCKFYKSGNEEEVVAKVGDKVLLRRDIASLLPKGITQSDSADQSKDFIQRWIKQELMLIVAEKNLTSEQKDFTRELEDYRSSLIIHRYQQKLLGQKLDTVLTENDIRQFYDSHSDLFILEQSIVKAVYVEIPKTVGKPDQIRRWMQANDDKSRTELESYSFKYATKFDYFNNQWVDFSGIKARMPLNNDYSGQHLKRNNFIEVNDTEKYYFVSIKDFRQAGEMAPFEYVKDRIENLILNNRKMEFIQELEKNIYQKGIKENLFKIMNR
jgi:hypothetical protein